MRTLVTGLSGFVGSHCASRIQAFDLTLDGRHVDLRDADAVHAAVQAAAPDAVIHLAAQSSVPCSFTDPLATHEVNFIGTLHLLMALERTKFRGRLLYVGSGDVYGTVPQAELPVVEDRPLRPRNPYAVSKVAAEALCYQWSQIGPFEVMMVRPFNQIGPGQSQRFAVSDFARQVVSIRSGREYGELIVGDLDATRDFTDVRDIVEAYLRVLESGVNGEIYNVCSGIERSLRSIVDTLCETAGVSVRYRIDEARLRPSEQRRMRGSYERLRSHTGWQPTIPFEQTLVDVLNHWEEQERA